MYKLVKHVFSLGSLFELQLWSPISMKWVAIYTSSKLKEVTCFAEKHGITLPKMEVCNNHK